jgi:hypothetical protein
VFADQSGATRAGLGVDQRGTGTFTLVDRIGRDLMQSEDEPEPVQAAPDTAAAADTARNPGGRR